ncbi:MAG: hypothetical protein LBC70_10255 [Chitinispirillales bacterium]|jgi:uncharacterized repeat protein (TIGR04138 family)|nr:hypothetical protein [Chitinispirillales bacterium]
MATVEFAEQVRENIIRSGVDDRYKIGAYGFVLRGLDFYISKIGGKRHVSGQELSGALIVFAHKQFGLMAKSVFDYWGVKTTGDLGCIVYNMIKVGMMDKQPGDSLDDFFDVADIRAVFKSANAECFQIDRPFIRKMKG